MSETGSEPSDKALIIRELLALSTKAMETTDKILEDVKAMREDFNKLKPLRDKLEAFQKADVHNDSARSYNSTIASLSTPMKALRGPDNIDVQGLFHNGEPVTPGQLMDLQDSAVEQILVDLDLESTGSTEQKKARLVAFCGLKGAINTIAKE
ncbi:hypothetical protein M426DRAFT_262975 [Hypoxylon sp. CI-4A]|nr:hypothetical protein M426DRAFT_262975 [Hypoxylon sp. CI-4A]